MPLPLQKFIPGSPSSLFPNKAQHYGKEQMTPHGFSYPHFLLPFKDSL